MLTAATCGWENCDSMSVWDAAMHVTRRNSENWFHGKRINIAVFAHFHRRASIAASLCCRQRKTYCCLMKQTTALIGAGNREKGNATSWGDRTASKTEGTCFAISAGCNNPCLRSLLSQYVTCSASFPNASVLYTAALWCCIILSSTVQ